MRAPRAANVTVLALGLAAAIGLAACGGDHSSDNVEWRFVSVQTSGSGTGGTVVGVRSLETAEAEIPVALRFRLFPDVVLTDPSWTPEPDLDGDGQPDRAWIEDGVLFVALSHGDLVVTMPAADDAVEARPLATGTLADLVVFRADGRTDLYVNETAP